MAVSPHSVELSDTSILLRTEQANWTCGAICLKFPGLLPWGGVHKDQVVFTNKSLGGTGQTPGPGGSDAVLCTTQTLSGSGGTGPGGTQL